MLGRMRSIVALALAALAVGALIAPLPYSVPAWEVAVMGAECEPLAGVPVERRWRFDGEPTQVDLLITDVRGQVRFAPLILWRSSSGRLVRFARRFAPIDGPLAPEGLSMAVATRREGGGLVRRERAEAGRASAESEALRTVLCPEGTCRQECLRPDSARR